MVVYTPRLCNDVAFLPPRDDRANGVQCREIMDLETIEKYYQLKAKSEQADALELLREAAKAALGLAAGDEVVGGKKKKKVEKVLEVGKKAEKGKAEKGKAEKGKAEKGKAEKGKEEKGKTERGQAEKEKKNAAEAMKGGTPKKEKEKVVVAEEGFFEDEIKEEEEEMEEWDEEGIWEHLEL